MHLALGVAVVDVGVVVLVVRVGVACLVVGVAYIIGVGGVVGVCVRRIILPLSYYWCCHH